MFGKGLKILLGFGEDFGPCQLISAGLRALDSRPLCQKWGLRDGVAGEFEKVSQGTRTGNSQAIDPLCLCCRPLEDGLGEMARPHPVPHVPNRQAEESRTRTRHWADFLESQAHLLSNRWRAKSHRDSKPWFKWSGGDSGQAGKPGGFHGFQPDAVLQGQKCCWFTSESTRAAEAPSWGWGLRCDVRQWYQGVERSAELLVARFLHDSGPAKPGWKRRTAAIGEVA